MITREQAFALRALLEKAATSLADADASKGVQLFPKMKFDGSLISYKTRINWNGTLKQAAQDILDTEQNSPDNAPTLWNDIKYKDGYRYIPEVITADQAFSLNEKGWWNDILYKSLYDANVNNPERWPQGWEKV